MTVDHFTSVVIPAGDCDVNYNQMGYIVRINCTDRLAQHDSGSFY